MDFPRFAPTNDVTGTLPLFLDTNAIVAQAGEYEIEYIFSYDDGFRTLGFSTLPRAE